MIRAAPPVYGRLRMTIPAREALAALGDLVEVDAVRDVGTVLWRVTLSRPPPSIVLGLVPTPAAADWCLRLDVEPEWPGEVAPAWWETGAWVPCPHRGCGRALVWYEAGRVPGWRLCTAGHHARLSADGRSAALRWPHRGE